MSFMKAADGTYILRDIPRTVEDCMEYKRCLNPYTKLWPYINYPLKLIRASLLE
jgi:hypothetical protein